MEQHETNIALAISGKLSEDYEYALFGMPRKEEIEKQKQTIVTNGFYVLQTGRIPNT